MEQSTEVWKPVVGYEGLYSVSSLGRVKSHVGRKVGKGSNYILKTFANPRGYMGVDLRVNGKGNSKKVHHLVLDAFVGKRPEGYQCNHKDGVKANNAVENLEWVTLQENVKHRDLLKLRVAPKGEGHPMVKLTEQKVLEIRAKHKTGVLQRCIANEFGITETNVSYIVKRKIWKHI